MIEIGIEWLLGAVIGGFSLMYARLEATDKRFRRFLRSYYRRHPEELSNDID